MITARDSSISPKHSRPLRILDYRRTHVLWPGGYSWCTKRHGHRGHITLLPILTGAREPARRHGAVIMASHMLGHVLTVLHSCSVLKEARLQ